MTNVIVILLVIGMMMGAGLSKLLPQDGKSIYDSCPVKPVLKQSATILGVRG